MMETVNNVVMIHLGTPPTTFDWQYTDKNSKDHKMSGLTPQKFYEEICPIDVTTKVSLINECVHPWLPAVAPASYVCGGSGSSGGVAGLVLHSAII